MSTRQGVAVIVAVLLLVGLVSCAAIRSCKRHRPPVAAAPRQFEKYADELPFKAAREIEHTWWAGDPPYHSWRDLNAAARSGKIVSAPDWLAGSTFCLSQGIGKKDRKHQSLYWMASPEVWEAICELSERTSKASVGQGRFRIESLARCVQYPLGQGSLHSSHNFARAFDVDLDNSGLTLSELTRLHAADWRPRLQSGWGIGCPNDMVFSMLVK